MNPNDRRQRIRDQMKEFYGDPSASPRKSEPRRSAGPPDMDLDSEYFDVSKYTTELLRRESLKGLVEADTELLRRVRRLDTELQELVYRNYAKFISATDTIREMHDNISEMDSKLQNLTSNVSNIDAISKQLTDSLYVHRGKIEETVTVNRMMKKAQFLMGLPDAMKKLIEKKEYSTCVKYWVAGDSFLKVHDTIPSIIKVRDQCRALARELYNKIEENMCSYPLDDPEAMDIIRKFVEDLRLLRSTSAAVSSEEESFEDTVRKALMRSVAANFSSGMSVIQRDMKAALTVPDFNTIDYVKRDQPLAEANLREALAQLKSVCALLSVNSERVYALLYGEESSGVAIRVAQEVQPVLIDILPAVSQLMIPLANASIAAVVDEAGSYMIIPEKHDTVPHMLMAVVNALLKQLKQLSLTLKQMGANYLDTAHSHQSASYAEMVDKYVMQILSGVVQQLKVKFYESPSEEAVARTAGPLRKDNLFANIAESRKIHREKIAFCLSRYAYASLAATLEEGIRSQLVGGEATSKDSTTEMCAQLENMAKDLQQRCIILLGALEAASVREDFGKSESISHVSESVQQLVQEWASLEEWLEGLVPPQSTVSSPTHVKDTRGNVFGMPGAPSYQSKPFSASSAGRSSDHTNSRGGKLQVKYTRNELNTLQSNVASIFSNKSQVYKTTPTDGRPPTTIACVILYVLKYLVECVRDLDTISEAQFQTVQINTTFLLRSLLAPHKSSPIRKWQKAWEDSVMSGMHTQLNEICTSAYERYEAKIPLPNTKLDAIVEESLRASRSTEDGSTLRADTDGTTPLGDTPDPALVEVMPTSTTATPLGRPTGPIQYSSESDGRSGQGNESMARHDGDEELPL